MTARKWFIILSIVLTGLIAAIGFSFPSIWWSMIVLGPLIIIGYYDVLQKKHTIKRNFPVIGELRYMFEKIRPEIMQYFVETDTEGAPFNHLMRSLVYERAKNVNDTSPFGTQLDTYQIGYEWIEHSIYAAKIENEEKTTRVIIGGSDCKKPYSASLLNISAMSFGALSQNAILALNKGAKLDNFAHNTGEGGLTKFHLQNGGDVIWQVGTGYFGCRNKDGSFSEAAFEKKATIENVKMIELKISQGAKPGHGGILPASKNTPEIAEIRGVEPFVDILSPPSHTAFSNATELMYFIKRLRELSGYKPVGFKLCIGKESEFVDICKAMVKTGIKPDFITIDGGEGGTGAAPIEFSNYMGMPMRDALAFAYNTLVGYDLKRDIKLDVSGKIVSGFAIARALALGADLCNSARAMMLAVGCIQALQCNTNTCPTGVATQNPDLIVGLDVEDKAKRAASFHRNTMKSFIEIISAMGVSRPEQLDRSFVNRRVSADRVLKYDKIYPYVPLGTYLKAEPLHQ